MGLDSTTTIESLKEKIKVYCEARDWDQYHDAKELSIGVITEAAELLENFRFQTKEQMQEIMTKAGSRKEVSDELADILFFLLRFCQRYDVDLSESFADKMERNAKRYPVEEFRGKNHKAHS